MNRLLLVVIIALVAACNAEKKEEPPTHVIKIEGNTLTLTPAQIKNAGIVTAVPQSRQLSKMLKLNGAIDVPPQNLVSVSVPMGGYLRYTKLLPGMHVTRGETIAMVEDREYIQLQEDYLTTSAQLGYSQAEYQRQQNLSRSGSGSDKALQQARAEFNAHNALKQSISQKLRLAGINPARVTAGNIVRGVPVASPISGFVSKVFVNVGKYVSPTDILFELVNPNDVHLNLTVFEKDLQLLQVGQRVIAYTNTNPDKKYLCNIILIGKDLTQNRSAQVHCHINNYHPQLVPGMYMNAEIELHAEPMPSIEETAVVMHEAAHYIFVSRGNNSYQMIPLQTGAAENGFVQLKLPDSLAGKPIVTRGAYSLLMALKNQPEEE